MADGGSFDIWVNDNWIRIFSVYFLNINYNDFVVKFLKTTHIPFLMGGDFNARNTITGDVSTRYYILSSNLNGTTLAKIIGDFEMKWNFANFSTCFRTSVGSKIDRFSFSDNFPFGFRETIDSVMNKH